MGTQRLRGRVSGSRACARGSRTRHALTATFFVVTSFTLLPALAGCSSFSSSSSSAAQAGSVPPPPNAAVAAPSAPPADEAGTSAYPYPKQSLVDVFRDGTDTSPPAQDVPRPPSAYTPSGQPYPANQPAYSAPVAASAAPPAAPPPPGDNAASGYPYPKQSLMDLFKDLTDSSPRVQNAPRPPSTYTPSAQPQ